MKLLKKYGLFIFWVLLFLDCFLINFKGLTPNRIYTKPLLLIALATYFYVNTKRSKHPRSKALVYIGLFFNWVGDWMFLISDFRVTNDIELHLADKFLFAGLCLYFIAFISYSFLLKKMSDFSIKDCQEAFLSFLAMAVVSVIYCKIVIYEVDKSDALYFKPLIYIGLVLLTIMLCLAANVAHNKVRKNIAWQFLIPASIILILSLGIIIGHRFFLKEADFLPGVIELTYGFGIMLMIRGFTKFLKA